MTAGATPRDPAARPLAVLTPFPIPPALHGKKVENLGDGFILRAIERCVGPFARERTFSPRVPLTPAEVEVLAGSRAVILAGANQLNDRWTIWPGLTVAALRESSLRLIPFGIGLHGEPGHTERLSAPTRELLLAVHERIAFSSWRCPRTVEYLRRELPGLAPQLLMTGCPVVYDRPLLDGVPFTAAEDRVAVTVTERQDFWTREVATIDHVARRFRRSRRFLVLHQNWSPPTRWELLRHRYWPRPDADLDPYQRLRRFAVRRGFRVVCPRTPDEAIAFYDTIDLHLGSRLHAHLLCLSRCKRSFLVPVDGRSTGIAEALGFPLADPHRLDAVFDCDFENVRAKARQGHAEMRRFLASIPA